MYQKVWKECHGAICSINFYDTNDILTNSITGFKSGNYLITDEFVYKVSRIKRVTLHFYKPDGYSIKSRLELTYSAFSKQIIRGIEDDDPGFAIVDIDYPEFSDIPSLSMSGSSEIKIGTPVALIGYQMEQSNIALKSGILSSYFKSNSHRYLQYDASVKLGNSGSPLIDASTCEVIGLSGNRLARLTRSHEQLMNIIKENLRALKEAENKISFEGIDPVQVLIANQNQIKHMARENYLNANIKMGYAIEISQIADYFYNIQSTPDLRKKTI
ncbi:MAG TPA: serine protease [Bacteroidales bacterium]|nr:serine protease [Bacteroidales bacterium]